jgi:hypothetical protein
MKKYFKIFIVLLLILIVSLAVFEIAQAVSLTPPSGSGSGSGTPLTTQAGTSGVLSLIGTIIKTILGIMGAVTLLMFVFGGFTMLSSGGLQDRIQQGKKALIWGALGLILIIMSYVIVDFVISSLTGVGAPVPPPTPPPVTADPVCSDGKDNDGDNKIDLDDPGCGGDPKGTSEENPGVGTPCTVAQCTQILHKPAKSATCTNAADCQTMIAGVVDGHCYISQAAGSPGFCTAESGGNCACIPQP